MGDSLVDQAMEVIRRTAVNASSYKLDFRKVFDEFDTSRDGLLSFEEMVRTFLRANIVYVIFSEFKCMLTLNLFSLF